MRLPRISPLYLGHLSRTTAKEIVLFGVIGVLFVMVALFEPYTHETPDGGIKGPLTLLERLGYAILLRAGYAEVKLIDQRDEDKKPLAISDVRPDEEISLNLIQTGHSELQCLNEFSPLGIPGVGQIDVGSLTIAIVAAEKYNRPLFQRRLEAWFAAILLPFRGKLSEFSFGLAQIRPATARLLLQEELGQFELSDRDLLALLMDDCHNIRLAAKYIEALCHQFASADSIDEIIAQVARTYSGAVTPTIHGLRYIDAVTGAYHLLTNENTNEIPEDASDQGKVSACLHFGIGSITATEDIASLGTDLKLDQEKPEESTQPTSEETVEVAEVHIYFRQKDPGPQTYVVRLATQRKDWLVGKLMETGYPRDRIVISEQSPPKYLRQRCEDSDSEDSDSYESWAGIEVQKGNKGERRQ